MPRRSSDRAEMLLSMAIAFLAVIVLFALWQNSAINSLLASMRNAQYISPEILYYVNYPRIDTSLTRVPANQTFCPENYSISHEALFNFSSRYYSVLGPGQLVTYSIELNTTSPVLLAKVLAPFRLVSFNTTWRNSSACAGRPNALKELRLVLQAPDTTFRGTAKIIVFYGD